MNFMESYGKIESDDRSFDRSFWQAQGPEAIFDAAFGMIKDYMILKGQDADEPRLSRTVEHFGKAQG